MLNGAQQHPIIERKALEEVAPMEIYTIQRPSLLLAAACAPSASWLPSTASAAVPAAKPKPAPASQVHQVQTQAELARTLVLTDGSYGTSVSTGIKGSTGTKGFVGNDSVKRMTDGASGVPPRGRPV
jgi:hypothetical protein